MKNFENHAPVIMRTIDEAYKELVKLDPNTAVTKYRIKQLVKTGIIPSVPAGSRKVYINFNTLLEYLAHPENFPTLKER